MDKISTQVTCSWVICSRICKKLDNIFQHWENHGFIQDWEQDADFEEKHKLHALGQYFKELLSQHW